MEIVGKVESLWRYPVKSMRGEVLEQAFVGFSGIYGDRIFAVRSSAQPVGLPYLTGREQEQMLLYSPRFRDPEKAAKPVNLAEAERMAPGITPLFADEEDLAVTVETPDGAELGIDDPALLQKLGEGVDGKHRLTLLQSHRSMTDCRPVSFISIQTVRQLGDEIGSTLDQRRFRANIYLDLKSGTGYDEDTYVGKTLQIGSKAVVLVLERDPRCKMITIDPDTAETNPEVLNVTKRHAMKAGLYGAVMVEGMVRPGDELKLLN